jgi:hypothetical protein
MSGWWNALRFPHYGRSGPTGVAGWGCGRKKKSIFAEKGLDAILIIN